jgi:hypothetical protein
MNYPADIVNKRDGVSLQTRFPIRTFSSFMLAGPTTSQQTIRTTTQEKERKKKEIH